MNKLDVQTRCSIVRQLVEGTGINATSRIVDVSKNTVLRLLSKVGVACAEYQYETLVGLQCRSVQVDEVWSFVHSKEKNIPKERIGEFGVGDVWVWSAVDPESRLIFSWHVGMREANDARTFMFDIVNRVVGRFQPKTVGNRAFLHAVIDALGNNGVDHAQLMKHYGNDHNTPEGIHRPEVGTACKTIPVMGNPDHTKTFTSIIERTNLTLQMHRRRNIHLTNGHSKKIENHESCIALHLMYYNFGKKHIMLKQTPAMAAGITDHQWTIEEIVGLLDRKQKNQCAKA